MNCSTCRYELSQCLDGRLPSGRRTLVLRHAAACSACATFWAELQAAQRLTLQLRRAPVSAGFRDQLWERIRAGEGTPEAVFAEPVPLLAKVRYALTGAAAAAAALLCITWWRGDLRQPPAAGGDAPLAAGDLQLDGVRSRTVADPAAGKALAPHSAIAASNPVAMPAPFEHPLFAATQRLTFDLVAVETAKQLDQRYAAATMAIRRMGDGGSATAVRQALENADEFCAFGELLLDLRDRHRLFFTEAEVGADLRVAVELLGQAQRADRTAQTVRTMVVPALRSNRLAAVSRTISLVPTLDAREELDVLQHLHLRRPEVFPKLFIVLGDAATGMDLARAGAAFVMKDECGPSWVAPRSLLEAHESMLRFQHGGRGGNGERVQVQFEVVRSR